MKAERNLEGQLSGGVDTVVDTVVDEGLIKILKMLETSSTDIGPDVLDLPEQTTDSEEFETGLINMLLVSAPCYEVDISAEVLEMSALELMNISVSVKAPELEEQVKAQIALEDKTSINALDALITSIIDKTDIGGLLLKFGEYMNTIKGVKSKHREHHVTLLEAVNASKAIKTILRTLIKEAVTAKSYIDRNVVAVKIGKKLLPKNTTGTAINKAVVALSLGLNLLNAAAHMQLVTYKIIGGKENHTISTLIVNPKLVTQVVKDAASRVRANGIMVCTPKPHTPFKAGGAYTASRTMLNSEGFNTIKLQSAVVCSALNALQEVAYSLKGHLTTSMLKQYKFENRWANGKGQFMQSEWHKLLADIELAQKGSFHFAVACDDRGRIYESSSYIKYQGDKYQKAMLEFTNKQVCTKEGLDMLMVAVCNELYSDKIEFSDAVAWVESKSFEELKALATGNPLAQVLVEDYVDAKAGKAIGTITHWDATNSGLQFYSLLGADKQTAVLCNVLNGGTIADAYKTLAEMLNKLTNSSKFNRSNVKRAFMVFLYGSMAKRILHTLEDLKNGVTHGIAEFFPADWSTDKMWETFVAAMETIAPSAIKLMNLVYTYNIEGMTKFRWIMPDGFRVETTSIVSYSGTEDDDKNKQVRGWFLDLQGKTHEGTSSVVVEEYVKLSRSLAPNVIHSVDAFFGREVIRRLTISGIEVSFIHDSFGVHPNHALTLQQTVREVAAYILELNLLEDILGQLNPTQLAWDIKKGRLTKGDLTKADVLASAYIVR